MRLASARRQRGLTLVVALLFLVLVTIITAATFNSSATNLRVTGNMVARQEALSASIVLLEHTISSQDFALDPAGVAAESFPVDIDGDGAPDYEPVLDPIPRCNRVRVLRTLELDVTRPADVACLSSSSLVDAGIDRAEGSAPPGSLCANTEWNVRAVTRDPRTGVSIAANQGVAVRVLVTDVPEECS
jgi:hypothetical protein